MKEVTFTVRKETKLYLVCDEDGDKANQAIGALNVKKSLFPGVTVGGKVSVSLNTPTPPVIGIGLGAVTATDVDSAPYGLVVTP